MQKHLILIQKSKLTRRDNAVRLFFRDWYKSKIQEPEQSWIRFFSNRRRLDFGTGLRRWKWQNTAGQGLAVRALIMASRD